MYRDTIRCCTSLYEAVSRERYGLSSTFLQAIQFTSANSYIALLSKSRSVKDQRRHRFFKEYVKEINWDSYSHSNSVYMKATPFRDEFYIGMTRKSCTDREFSRLRKFRQQGLTNVEPAIHWWRNNDNFHEFILLPLAGYETEARAFEAETTWVLETQAPLNVPFINKLQKGRKFEVPRFQTNRQKRLFSRYRLTKSVSNLISAKSRKWTPTSDLMTLHWLTETGRPSFSCQKILRHHTVSSRDLFRLNKLSKSIEEPKRSKAACEVRKALLFKECSLPPLPRAFRLPILSSSGYMKSFKDLLKHVRQQAINHGVPYHPVSLQIVEVAWPSVADKLCNFRRPPPSFCNCQSEQFANIDATGRSENGHLVLEGGNLKKALNLRSNLVLQSIKQAQWPNQRDFCEAMNAEIQKCMDNFCITHEFRIQIQPTLDKWMHEQWQLHQRNTDPCEVRLSAECARGNSGSGSHEVCCVLEV